MKMTKLVRAAIDAQVVLVKSTGRQFARRAVLLGVAAVFGLFALGLLHAAAYLALERDAGIAPVWSALIVVGGDALIGVVLLVMARAGGPDARAIEARITRDRAINDLRSGLAIATISGPAGRLAGRGVMGAIRRATSRRGRSRAA